MRSIKLACLYIPVSSRFERKPAYWISGFIYHMKYEIWMVVNNLTILEIIPHRDVLLKSRPKYRCLCSCWIEIIATSLKIHTIWYCWIRWRHRKIIKYSNYAEIELSNWDFSKIDIDDIERVIKHCWVKTKHNVSQWYAHAKIKWKYIKLHTFITWYKFVDHINRLTLDNRKTNLRESNSFLNARNTNKNIIIEFKWKKQCLMDWSIELWINRETLRYNFHKWKHIDLMKKVYSTNSSTTI